MARGRNRQHRREYAANRKQEARALAQASVVAETAAIKTARLHTAAAMERSETLFEARLGRIEQLLREMKADLTETGARVAWLVHGTVARMKADAETFSATVKGATEKDENDEPG